MTTHFTSGVTNVSADGTLGKLKAPAPQKYHSYFNDFDTYLASDWTITTTEDGTGSATEALADGDGGPMTQHNLILLLACNSQTQALSMSLMGFFS